MARRNKTSNSQVTRVASVNATVPVRYRTTPRARFSVSLPPLPYTRAIVPALLEDRRRNYPGNPAIRPFTGSNRDAVPLTARESKAMIAATKLRSPRRGGDAFLGWGKQTRAIVAFRQPARVAVCVRRSIRKQVLHAFGVAGGRVGKPRWSDASRQRC